jgi:hypothetical protein
MDWITSSFIGALPDMMSGRFLNQQITKGFIMNAFRFAATEQRGRTLLVGGLELQRARLLAGMEAMKPEVAFVKFIGEVKT